MVTETKVEKLENKTVRDPEMDTLIERVLMDFEPEKLLFDENRTRRFIEELYRVGMSDWEAIYSLFEDNARRGGSYYVDSGLIRGEDLFEGYDLIFFWVVSNRHDISYGEHRSKNIDETNEYIQKITEDILKNRMDLLVAEIRIASEAGQIRYADLSPMYLCHNESYKFYPPELFEKIKEMIPENELLHFKYDEPEELNPDSDKAYEEEVEDEVEFPNPLELYFKRHEKKEAEHDVLDDSDMGSEKNCTKKDLYDKWNSLMTSDKEYVSLQYREILDKWGKHFPPKLLRAEVKNGNNECICGALGSENKYIFIPLFAFLVSGNYNIEISRRSSVSRSFGGVVVKDEKIVHEEYYKLLLDLFTNTYNCYLADYFFYVHEYYDNIILRDILDIINSRLEIGRRILNHLEKNDNKGYRYYFRHELTSEQLDEIEKLDNLSGEYNQLYLENEKIRPHEKLGHETVDDEGDKKISFSDPSKPPRNEFDIKMSEICRSGKGPLVLRQRTGQYCRDGLFINEDINARSKHWLYEHKRFDLKSYRLFTKEGYKGLRDIILDKPFFHPEFSDENEWIMAHYFYRESLFADFIASQGQEQYYLFDVLWRRFWQNFIEETYKNFKQADLGKPSLPIIPEFAEYLLSRTGGILFSSASEGLVHCHYRAFLTGCRKLQIDKLLKKGSLRQEEADKLIAMAENPDTDYYAWSDQEIKEKECLLPETDLEKLHADLEPEFMVKIFDRSIWWVIEHKDSELWATAPWFGMRIFNKSYADRPSVWAKHLIKIVDGWTGSENMLLRICFALGHLREPLGGDVPIILQKVAERQKNDRVKRLISIQRNLFNRENFNKGHHRSPLLRVKHCREELIKGQNKEVESKK